MLDDAFRFLPSSFHLAFEQHLPNEVADNQTDKKRNTHGYETHCSVHFTTSLSSILASISLLTREMMRERI